MVCSYIGPPSSRSQRTVLAELDQAETRLTRLILISVGGWVRMMGLWKYCAPKAYYCYILHTLTSNSTDWHICGGDADYDFINDDGWAWCLYIHMQIIGDITHLTFCQGHIIPTWVLHCHKSALISETAKYTFTQCVTAGLVMFGVTGKSLLQELKLSP